MVNKVSQSVVVHAAKKLPCQLIAFSSTIVRLMYPKSPSFLYEACLIVCISKLETTLAAMHMIAFDVACRSLQLGEKYKHSLSKWCVAIGSV